MSDIKEPKLEGIRSEEKQFVFLSPELREACIRILESLAQHDGLTKYRVETETRIAHGTVFKAFEELIHKGLIKEKSSKLWRTGKQTVTYELSFGGFAAIYPRIRRLGYLNRKAGKKTFYERFSHFLPLILGKWNHFKEHGLQDVAASRLEYSLLQAMNPEEIYTLFFLYPFSDRSLQQIWLNMIREDKEIQQKCTNLTNNLISYHQGQINELENVKSIISSQRSLK